MSNLHNEIMNLQIKQYDEMTSPSTLSYKLGHRDARHSAAELSLKYQSYIEDLEQIASQAIGSGLLEQLKKDHNV